MKRKTYSIDDQLAGLDLYGLSCRIPKPTKAQAKCSHTKVELITRTDEDYWTGKIISEEKYVRVCAYEDIPNTNNIRCSCCGYTRRY